MNSPKLPVRVPFLLFLAAGLPACGGGDAEVARPSAGEGARPRAPEEDTSLLNTKSHEWTFESRFLGDVIVMPEVLTPMEAEYHVLPLIEANPELFEGKAVLEIGTGSGAIGVYAAMRGARKVVMTDISQNAVRSAERNAEVRGVSDVVDVRLVSEEDMSAYAVIGANERFDTIISNPPYSLDLDAPKNDALSDTGDLGLSIVDGLDAHLEPGGRAMLLYDSLFYHMVMVKYARAVGFEVRYRRPDRFMPWEASAVFNSYLGRLLEVRGVEEDLRFSRKDPELDIVMQPLPKNRGGLFPNKPSWGNQPSWMSRGAGGWMVIERK